MGGMVGYSFQRFVQLQALLSVAEARDFVQVGVTVGHRSAW